MYRRISFVFEMFRDIIARLMFVIESEIVSSAFSELLLTLFCQMEF